MLLDENITRAVFKNFSFSFKFEAWRNFEGKIVCFFLRLKLYYF